MSSLAQEESRSISENVTWGQRKRFADGKVMMPYKRFMGYEKGPDGQPRIVEAEAKIIREIYDLFISGRTPKMIAKEFTQRGVPTPGGQAKWYEGQTFEDERYAGAACRDGGNRAGSRRHWLRHGVMGQRLRAECSPR